MTREAVRAPRAALAVRRPSIFRSSRMSSLYYVKAARRTGAAWTRSCFKEDAFSMNLRKIISKFALPNAKWLMRALAASVEALLHHTFGERYTLSLFSGLLVVAILASLVPAEKPAALMPFVTVAVFVRLLAHLVSVWRRRRTGLHVESHSSGSSWRFWSKLGLPVGIIYIFLEPLLCLAVGLVLAPVDHLFSVWLCFSGLALMLKTVIERHRTHNGMLDLLDARTAARNQRAAGHQQPNLRPDPPNNPITANAATPLTPARPLPSLFRNLDPALQRLMHDDAPRATEPLAPQPAAGGMVAASQQPTAHVSGQSSTPGRIHVRPARLQESSPPPVPLGNPRVVLVRTRPAPAPLRVRPSVPASSPLNATSEKPSSPVIGPLGTAPILHPSETVLSANIPEFAKPEHAEFTESTVLKGEAAGGRRDFDEHDTLCRQVEIEAMRLGFAVEPS